MFNVSIIPTTYCNLRCKSCYLTVDQLTDKTTLPISTIEQRLADIPHSIDVIDIYGGEVMLLPDKYMNELITLSLSYTNSVNVITNLTISPLKRSWIQRDDFELSVSWDYTCRDAWDTTLANMMMLEYPFHVLLLANDEMVTWGNDHLLKCKNILNAIHNISTVEIKPYSSNQSNDEGVTFKQFEEFLLRWIEDDTSSNWTLVNNANIAASLERRRNAWSDDHIYVMPSGKYGVLKFDANDREYFCELDTFSQYTKWANTEKQTVTSNPICSKCEFLGSCLSEHIRVVHDLANSCNGFKLLLENRKAHANRS